MSAVRVGYLASVRSDQADEFYRRRPSAASDDAFDPGALAKLDEPVRRYLAHAIHAGAALSDRVRLSMSGRIRVGTWLSFVARQDFDGHAFAWRARAGSRRLKPLHVTDRYAPGAGSTEGRLLGRMRFLHATDENTTRAAAARAAAESIWVPTSLLPSRGTAWRAVSDELIIATVDVPPERPTVELTIAADGRVRSVRVLRWGNVGQKTYGYIPFGGEIDQERRFGDLTLPSRVSVGWWFGTPRYAPFFEAEILDAQMR